MGILQQKKEIVNLISEYKMMAARNFVPVTETKEEEVLEECYA